MNATWYSLHNFHLLWLLPVLALIFVWAEFRRRTLLSRFAAPELRSRLTASLSYPRRFWKAAFLLIALASLIIALCRPAWNPVPQEIRRSGRDVVFLLDVSRSMLADDLKPSRLERAKIAINDCLDVLQGDRVALALFAGTTVVKCPLTQDYGFFRMALADAGPDSVSRGGTLLGDALRKVSKEVFDEQQRQYKDIVLITDGEDHESFPVEAAKVIGKDGVRLLAVGLGDESSGSMILYDNDKGGKTLLKYHGEVVRSKLDSDTLRQMAEATPGGRYLPVSTGNFDLGEIYRELIAGAERREIESHLVPRLEEKFQIFLVLTLAFLALSAILRERRTSAVKDSSRLAVALAIFTLTALTAKAADILPNDPVGNFNRGLEAYRNKDYQQAREFFEAARDQNYGQYHNSKIDARARLALGNATYQLARQEQTDLNKAIQNLEEAREFYSDAAKFNPKLEVAEQNRIIADLTLKQLLFQRQQQQEQQKQQAQQNQQQQQQLQQLADKQQQQADQSRQEQQEQEQEQQQQEQQQQEQQQQEQQQQEQQQQEQQQQEQQQQEPNTQADSLNDRKQAQQELQEQTEQVAEQLKQNPQAADARQKTEEAMEHQANAQQALDNNDLSQAADEQQQAADALRQAAEALSSGSQDKQEASGEQEKQQSQDESEASRPESDSPDDSGNESPSEENQNQDEDKGREDEGTQDSESAAVQLSDDARDILDEERKNLKLRQRAVHGNISDVDKDW